jgi:glycosyltransferase 2 family protein
MVWVESVLLIQSCPIDLDQAGDMKDLRTKLILGALIGVTVVVAMLLLSDLREVGTHLSEFPLYFMFPVLSLTLCNYALRWVKWHLYLKVIGVRDMPKIDSATLFVAGFVLALSPGKAAELLKAAALKMMNGTPVARSAPVILAERVSDGLAMMILAAIGFGGMALSTQGQQNAVMQYMPAYFIVLGVMIGGIILVQIRPLFFRVLDLIAKIPLVGRLSPIFSDLYTSSYELFRPIPLAWSVGLGVVSWGAECIAFFLILAGLGFTPGWLLVWQAMFILASSSIIGAISGLPGGLGATDFTILGMVNLLILNGNDTGLAGTASLLVRLSTLWFGVSLGLLTAFVFRNRLFPAHSGSLWAATGKEPEKIDSSA